MSTATVQSTGSNLLPGSPSFSSPTRWNNWTVDVVCGVLTLVALYVIWKLTHSSTQAPPKQESNSTASFLAKQHPISIPASDETIPCINEIAPLRHFEKFGEGVIRLDMAKQTEAFSFTNDLKLFIPGLSKPFFECKAQKVDTIFVPNLPYFKEVILNINNAHFNLFNVKYPRGLYTVSFSDATSHTIALQELTKTSDLEITECRHLLTVDGMTIIFNDDGTSTTSLQENDSFLIMENQGAARAVYMQITIPEKHRLVENQNIVLIWMLEAKQKKTLTRNELKDKCQDAYNAATNKDVSFDDNDILQLQAIAHRAYADIPPPAPAAENTNTHS
ncbi:MAG TPA: hypothetical protein VFU89_00870 [Rhabdochlamydiaceae bacterium]|nr:hypothetical protein [Rhabdochlamydiaceae bacterium]